MTVWLAVGGEDVLEVGLKSSSMCAVLSFILMRVYYTYIYLFCYANVNA